MRYFWGITFSDKTQQQEFFKIQTYVAQHPSAPRCFPFWWRTRTTSSGPACVGSARPPLKCWHQIGAWISHDDIDRRGTRNTTNAWLADTFLRLLDDLPQGFLQAVGPEHQLLLGPVRFTLWTRLTAALTGAAAVLAGHWTCRHHLEQHGKRKWDVLFTF